MANLRPLSILAALVLMPLLLVAPTEAQWPANGAAVCTAADEQYGPSIASDWMGGAYVSWTDSRFGDVDVYTQRIDPTGSVLWSTNGVAVSTASGSQNAPLVVPDWFNGAIVFWGDTRTSNPGPGVFAQRLNTLGVPLWTPNGIRIATGDPIFNMSVIPDGNPGTVQVPGYIVGWMERSSIGNYWVRAQHMNLEGTLFWGTGAVRVSATPGFKAGLTIATDGVANLSFGSRGIVLAWSEDRLSTGDDIMAGRVNQSGVSQWGQDDGYEVCDLAGDQANPAIAYVGATLTMLVWDDKRTPDCDIYAQKLDRDGLSQWLADGLPVCRAPGTQSLPAILPDGAGGAFMVWIDQRSAPWRVYGQRLNASGLPLWTVDGIPLCTMGTAALQKPKLISDGAGGFLVIWADTRSGNQDMYAQRVDGNGNLLWPGPGVPVCIASGPQTAPVLLSDGASGMIAAWNDERGGAGSSDIYAKRVTANGGGNVDVPRTAPAGFELALASANPARNGARFNLSLPEAARVEAEILDIAGRLVRRIEPGARFEAGHHPLVWDGADDAGARVGSGVFFIRVSAGTRSSTARIVMLR